MYYILCHEMVKNANKDKNKEEKGKQTTFRLISHDMNLRSLKFNERIGDFSYAWIYIYSSS